MRMMFARWRFFSYVCFLQVGGFCTLSCACFGQVGGVCTLSSCGIFRMFFASWRCLCLLICVLILQHMHMFFCKLDVFVLPHHMRAFCKLEVSVLSHMHVCCKLELPHMRVFCKLEVCVLSHMRVFANWRFWYSLICVRFASWRSLYSLICVFFANWKFLYFFMPNFSSL